MYDWSYFINCLFKRVLTFSTYGMLASLLKTMEQAERGKIKAALGHEPSQENLEDLRELEREKASMDKSRQREIDREKLRRLVFGENG